MNFAHTVSSPAHNIPGGPRSRRGVRRQRGVVPHPHPGAPFEPGFGSGGDFDFGAPHLATLSVAHPHRPTLAVRVGSETVSVPHISRCSRCGSFPSHTSHRGSSRRRMRSPMRIRLRDLQLTFCFCSRPPYFSTTPCRQLPTLAFTMRVGFPAFSIPGL